MARYAARKERKTSRGWESLLKRHILPALGSVKLRDLRPSHLARLYDHLRRQPSRRGGTLSERTILHVHRLLHLALGHAASEAWGPLIDSNPAAKHRIGSAYPEPEKTDQDALAEDELHAIFDAVRGDHLTEALVIVGAFTGLRRSELLGLQWPDMDLERSEAHVRRKRLAVGAEEIVSRPKTGDSWRVVKLTEEAVTALKAWRPHSLELRLQHRDPLVRQEPWVFPIKYYDVERVTARLRRLGVRLARQPIHGLRHTLASILLAEGVPLPDVSDVLGHSSPAVTAAIYSHKIKGRRDAVQSMSEAMRRARDRGQDLGKIEGASSL
jgi:integrase